ncbi:MAG: RNA polymerase sigma factor [Fimbriimonas sp.]
MTDLDLAARLAEGDSDAGEALVREHYAPLFRFLRPLTRCREDAEDLALQTLQKGRLHIRRFDGRAPLRTWLYRVAYREYLHWRRRHRWHLNLFAAPPRTEAGYERVLLSEWLRELLTKVPEAQRVAFVLHEMQEIPIEEIAEITGVPAGTVKSRLHHARRRLQTLIQDPPEETAYAPEPSRP